MKKLFKVLVAVTFILTLLGGCAGVKSCDLSSFHKANRDDIRVYLERDDFSMEYVSLKEGNVYEDDEYVYGTIEENKTSIVESIGNIMKFKTKEIDEQDIGGNDFVIIKNKENNSYLRLYSDAKAILMNDEGKFAIEFTDDNYSKEYNNIIESSYSIEDVLDSLYPH